MVKLKIITNKGGKARAYFDDQLLQDSPNIFAGANANKAFLTSTLSDEGKKAL